MSKKVEAYKLKFAEINKEYGIFTPELEAFLGEDFYISPASNSVELPGCYPGGLLCHLMAIAKYAVKLNDALPEKARADKKSLMKVVFLSQIGRTFIYKVSTNEWMAKNKGIMYEYNDLIRLSISERSLLYATKNGVKLTDEEYQAILYSDKDDTDKMPRIMLTPLAQLIKIGSQMAIIEDKANRNG